MLTAITIIIILTILFSMNQTIRTLIRICDTQDAINRELKQRIENRDNFMCKVQEELNKHIKEETEIYELIKNFGKGE